MSATRVTHRTISTTALANLQANLAATQRLTDRLSSGRAIQRPSDDPSGTVSALQIRSDSRAQQQFMRNANDGLAWLSATDGALSNGVVALRRARELVIQGANTGANGQQAREALATEVKAIREGLVETANTRYLGRPVFGGTTSGDRAFAADGSYLGDSGRVERRVSAQSSVRADTPGRDIFTSGGRSVFEVLDRVAANLTSSPDGLQADLDELSVFFDRFTAGLSDVGARYSRIESQRQVAEKQVLDLRSALSEVENIDLPKTVMDLQLQQVAYQASLGATARVIQPTLMDFLR